MKNRQSHPGGSHQRQQRRFGATADRSAWGEDAGSGGAAGAAGAAGGDESD